jgi:hypothetical protein
VQLSSLVFVAIVGIWAAFLVQHWVRRRETMATARSVDRFSESIRMLDRQPVVPSPSPRPDLRVYAVASPFVARRAVAPGTVGGPAGAGRPVQTRPAPTTGAGPAPGVGARPAYARPGARSRSRRQILARRIRGLAFLAVAALVPVSIVLSAIGVLLWPSVAVSVVALAVGVFLLRYGAVRERTRRRLDRSIAASVRRTLDAPAALERTTRGLSLGVDGSDPVERPTAGASESSAEQSIEPGTWVPRPVPPPTYTLKAKAPERPEVMPAEVTPTPAGAGESAGSAAEAAGAAEAGERRHTAAG